MTTTLDTMQKLLAARQRPHFGVMLGLPIDSYTATSKGVRIVITGRSAQEITNGPWGLPRLGKSWTEVQGMHECNHGCKLYGRRRGCVNEFMLMHSASYGCQLGRDETTRDVPVSIRPKAGAR